MNDPGRRISTAAFPVQRDTESGASEGAKWVMIPDESTPVRRFKALSLHQEQEQLA